MMLGWKVMLPLAMAAVAWTALAVFLAEELGKGVTAVLALIALVLFFGGAQWWLTRVGHKAEGAAGAGRIESVSLSRQVKSGR